MSIFSRKKAAVVEPTPVGSFDSPETQRSLTEILRNNHIVDVVADSPIPFLVVTPRVGTIGEPPPFTYGFGDTDTVFDDVFKEPTASERAQGQGVRKYPTELTSGTQFKDAKVIGLGKAEKYVAIGELGTSAPSPFTSFIRRDYNRDLLGLRGKEIYDKMRRNDGVVRGTLRTFKTPILAARWFVIPDDKTKVADVNAACFVWKNLTELMSIGWNQFLTESLLMCEFGYYMFEIVWEERVVDGQDRIVVAKLAPRHPMDVKEWLYDHNGGPLAVVMYNNEAAFQGPDIIIPIEKLLIFTFDREAGDVEGISVLRSAYKHWYFKEQLYKIDAIQKERHGIGVPIIELPPGFNEDDKMLANELGRNIRTNERAHISLPPNWKFSFAKLEGQPVNVLESIQQHDAAIRENVLVEFMGPNHTGTDDERQQTFLKSTRFAANIVCETINIYLVPKMIAANFQRVGNPKLKARRIGENEDWRTLSFAIRNLIGAGALIPDDPLEEMLREEMDLPEIDEATRRAVATPNNLNMPVAPPSETGPKGEQNQAYQQQSGALPIPSNKQQGGVAGLPKQRSGPPAPHQQRPNAGQDRSGG